MQKIIALSLVFLLSSCVSPTVHMANNKFNEEQPSIPVVSGIGGDFDRSKHINHKK